MMPKTRKLLISVLFACSALGMAASTPESQYYTTLKQPLTQKAAKNDTDTSEVIEFFSYGCPHCFHFDPMLRKWAEKHPDVEVTRIPVTFNNPRWKTLAKAYYIARAYGKAKTLSPRIFKAIHKKHRRLDKPQKLKVFFKENGITPTQFEHVYDAPSMKKVLKDDTRMVERANLRGVPALVVNGRYLVSPSQTNGLQKMLKVTSQLIAQ